MPLDATNLDRDPIRQLEAWLAEATDAGVALPNAFALATADGAGTPSVRFVPCGSTKGRARHHDRRDTRARRRFRWHAPRIPAPTT